jgi:LPS O-antigen subunit length determinant protein (WzzB/FepE family)
MEEKSEPDRVSIFILGTIFGFLLSVSLILIRYYLILKQT